MQCRDLEDNYNEKVRKIAVATLEDVAKDKLDKDMPDDVKMVRGLFLIDQTCYPKYRMEYIFIWTIIKMSDFSLSSALFNLRDQIKKINATKTLRPAHTAMCIIADKV